MKREKMGSRWECIRMMATQRTDVLQVTGESILPSGCQSLVFDTRSSCHNGIMNIPPSSTPRHLPKYIFPKAS